MGNVAVYKKGTTNFFSQGLGLLSDVVSSNLTQTVSSTGNVEQKLEVEYPIDGYLVSELVEGAILRVSVSTDKSDYGVFEIVDTLKDDSGTITVYGDPYYNRILRMSFDNGGLFTKFSSVQSALNAAKQNITGFPADFNLISNLSTSVDLSENTYDTFSTFLEALNSAVHGNIKYSLNSIQIYSAIGKDVTDITLRDDMNTSSVKITTDFSGIINKVIPVLPVLDKDGNATDQTKVGTIVTSKYSNQFLDYWAGKVIQFDTQDLANTYFDRTNADRPVQTVDVDPIGLDDDFSTINIFDTIELYSTRLDYTDKLRVSERVFDTLAENVTSFKLGSSSVNIFNQINEQNNEIFNNVVKLTNAAISANGKGIDYFGQAQPASPKEGDTWFWDDGTDFGIKQYTNGEWVDLAGSNTADKIAAGVTEAVTQANAHTDEVKQGLSTDIATAKSQAASQASTAEANAKSAATSQFTQAQNALSAAKSDLTNSIASEASARNQAVATANSQAQTYANQAKADALNTISKEVTDRQNAVSALDTKATNAVNQAKSDITDTINAISVGGRNYFLNSSGTSLEKWNNNSSLWSITTDSIKGSVFTSQPTVAWTGGAQNALYQNGLDALKGQQATVSFWAKADKANANFHSEPQGGAVTFNPKLTTSWAKYGYTIPNLATATIYFMSVDVGTNYYLDNLKIEVGNKATDWTAAPEDVVLDYTTKDNQIKTTISQYQTTNDSKVSKAQTDATTALGLVATKVSQTDYDTKTDDLTTKYTQVKQTVDSQATDIVNIKATATSQASKINSISSDVDGTKQSISDIETTQDSQSDKINQITTDVNGTKQSISDIQTKDGQQDTRMGTIETSVSGVKSDFSSYKTTNDGAVKTAQTTAQTAVDGLKTKVSQTDYDKKTGQLQTDLTSTTQTANKATTDIVSIQQKDNTQDARMTQIESDASGVKTTVSNLQTAQGKQSGDISTLQQRADGFDATVTKINAAVNSLGQVNQLFNTEFSPDFAGWYAGNSSTSGKFTATAPLSSDTSWSLSSEKFNGSNVLLRTYGSGASSFYSDLIPLGSNTPVSVSMSAKSSSDYTGTVTLAFYLRYYDSNKNYLSQKVWNSNKVTSWSTFTFTDTTPADTAYIVFNILTNGSAGTSSYSQPMLVFSSTVGTYVQGNYNNNSATAKAQLTADQATLSINNYKTDADGRISKAQADIITNANAITQKVSQTDYDKKTGDLDTRVTKAQTTADGAVTTVGNYKTSNDARVKATETSIAQNAKDITLRATTADLNSAKSDLNSSISQVKITADNINNFVRDPSGNISSDFQTALSKSSVIVDGNNKMISLINQKSDEIVAQISSVNLFPNSEFESDYGYESLSGDVKLSLAYKWVVGSNQNGVVEITTTASSYQGYIAEKIAVFGGSTISFSVLAHYEDKGVAWGQAGVDMRFFDKDGNETGKQSIYIYPQADYWHKLSLENIYVPDTSVSLSITLIVNDAGAGQYAVFAQPMLVNSSTIKKYAPNTDITTTLMLLKDKWAIGLADNIGNITSGIIGDSSSMSLISKNIVLDGNTTVTGDFKVWQANIANGAIGTAQIGDAAITSAKIANLDVSKITGNVSNFIQSNWNGEFGSSTMTATGLSVSVGNSFLSSTFIGSDGISYTHGGGQYGAIGIANAGFNLQNNPLGGAPLSIVIGDGNKNPAENMAFAIVASQSDGSAPQLIWAGSNTGNIATKYRTWSNPRGFIMADNIKFSTWDSTASRVEVDDTVNFYNYAPVQVYGQRFSEGTRSLQLGGMDYGSSGHWFGFLSGDKTAGFGTDNTQDVLFFVKGKRYSLYTMLNKLGML